MLRVIRMYVAMNISVYFKNIYVILFFCTTTGVGQDLPVPLFGLAFSDLLITYSKIVSPQARFIRGLNPWDVSKSYKLTTVPPDRQEHL